MKLDTVKQIREELGCSIMEAKRIAQGRELLGLLKNVNRFSDVETILKIIIKDLYPEPKKNYD